MAVSRTLKRLLRVRELEEEQRRLVLESASSALRRLENTLAVAQERGRQGSRLVTSSAGSGELSDRLAGMEEVKTSERFSKALTPRIQHQEAVVTECREEFMEKRIERRQAETLIEESQAQHDLEAGRRSQQAMDDWYSNKLYREGSRQEPSSARAAAEDRPAWHASQFFLDDFENSSIKEK